MGERTKPHHRVLILAISLLALMAAVVGIAVLNARLVSIEFHELTDRDVPANELLTRLDREIVSAQLTLEAAALANETGARSRLLSTYGVHVEDADRLWIDYRQLAVAAPAEVELHDAYDDAHRYWQSTNERIVRTISEDSTPSASMVTESGSAFASLTFLIRSIENDFAKPQLVKSIDDVNSSTTRSLGTLVSLLIFGLIVGFFISRAAVRSSRERDEATAVETRARRFEASINQALDMAQTEDAALESIQGALEAELPEAPIEMLLADSSRAHLQRVLETDSAADRPGCGVTEPSECPAIRRGATQIFEDSSAYFVCPHLRKRPGLEPCSAVCVPVSIAGRTTGVLHVTGDHNTQPPSEMVQTLERLLTQAGDRVGVLRAFAQSQTQASTDPLTGLYNRRSFENAANEQMKTGQSMALAYADLDHFKNLNDTHGHDAGDRALRTFAQVLRDSLRDGDLPARWGGEEFVIMFPNRSIAEATQALERIRGALGDTLKDSTVPGFSSSFGVTDTTCASHLDELVSQADAALLEAKRLGRDRIVPWGSWATAPETTRDIDPNHSATAIPAPFT